MTNVLVRHTVEDYEKWKPHFDDHASTREEYGEGGYRLFRVSDDPEELVILFEWDSAENARSFLEDSDLQDVMTEAGVVGEPEVHILDEIEARTPGQSAA